MSIASEIQRIKNNIAGAYTACEEKGGTLPTKQNSENLASCIQGIPAASEPVITSLTVTPNVIDQTITVPSGTDGFNPINVSAVTSSIDANIQAENIRKNITILGVVGTFQPEVTSISISPTTTLQTIIAPSGIDGYSSIKVSAVTSSIDSNIQPENIKKNITILGVTGNVETPAGTVTITTNGTYDVSNYENAEVSVGNFVSMNLIREATSDGILVTPVTSFTYTLPSNIVDVSDHALENAYVNCTGITFADLSSLTALSGSGAATGSFYGCINLTSADLSSLITISGNSALGNAFYGCTNLTSVDLSSLTIVDSIGALSSAFQNCVNLTSIDLSSLTTVIGSSAMSSTFRGCTKLASVDLSSLATVSGSMSDIFRGCTKLASVDLSSLTTIEDNSSLSSNGLMSSAFFGCTSLVSMDLSSLTTVDNIQGMSSIFHSCTNLTTVDLSG